MEITDVNGGDLWTRKIEKGNRDAVAVVDMLQPWTRLTLYTRHSNINVLWKVSNYRAICGVRVGYLLLICESIKVNSKFP